MALRIEDYALIGDTQTAALVGTNGSIDWLCVPRFDSAACFASLLGTDENGSWVIGPVGGGSASSRRYRDGSLVLETDFETADGAARLVDFMPARQTHPRIVRIVEGVRGSVEMETRFTPRMDYGKTRPWVRGEGNDVAAGAGPEALRLRADVPLTLNDYGYQASFTVGAGDRVGFVLTSHSSWEDAPPVTDASDALGETDAWWRDWSGAVHLPRRLGRRGRAFAHHAEGTHLRADRRYRGRRDHVPAGVPRRRPELGLPVLLASRCRSDAGRLDGRRIRRRGPGGGTGCASRRR